MNISKKTQKMILTAIFAAIIIVMTAVPFLGYIPLGVTRATLIQVPVIVGAILLGPKIGAILGLVFGLTSLWVNTFSPTITSFCFSPFYNGGNFWSLVICLVPRVLIGVGSYYTFVGLKKLLKVNATGKTNKPKETVALALSGLVGSLINTVLVMGMIYIFFAEPYAAAREVTIDAVFGLIMGVISVNGVMEAIVSALLTALVCRVMLHVKLYND